jgi:acyl carrier protein
MEIKKTLKRYIADNILRDGSIVFYDDDSFLEKGLIDSTGVLELVSFIEETFDIRVEDEELIPENLDSLNRLTTYVELKLKNK